MKKKILLCVFALICVLLSGFAVACASDNYDVDGSTDTICVIDGIRYRIVDNVDTPFAEIIGTTDISGDVKIPETISYNDKDYNVTSIGERGAFSNSIGLTSVEIPNTVTSIVAEAFLYCNSLTVYCEASYKPSGWDNNWDSNWESLSCPVIWDCKNNDRDVDGYAYAIIDGIRYSLKDGIATVVGQPINLSGSIAIPTRVTYKNETYDVKSIGRGAFVSCDIFSIVIPNSVTSIGDWAFNPCFSLMSIEIADSVTSIGEGAFWGCSSLTSIEIPDSVTSIGESAFGGCSSLTSITLPFVGNTKNGTSNTHFGYIFGASSYSENSDDVPASLKTAIITDDNSIGSSAFYGCSGLTSIEIPNSVTSIGNGAFFNCSSLTSIKMPNGVTSLEGGVFRGCSGLTSIVIPNSVTSIGDNAFWDCSSLISIVIPNSVTNIGQNVFCGCSGLTNVIIGYSVTSIGMGAFLNCSGLTSVVIPNTVTRIGYQAFYKCDNLTIYCEAESQPSGWDSDWNYSNCPVIWGYNSGDPDPDDGTGDNTGSDPDPDDGNDDGTGDNEDDSKIVAVGEFMYVLHDGAASAMLYVGTDDALNIPSVVEYEGVSYSVTSIFKAGFASQAYITSVNIPETVTDIGVGAFYCCSGLESITVNSGNPVYRSADNCLINVAEKTLVLGCKNSIIPTDGSVTVIGTTAFGGCSGLTEISIPNCVTEIGESAFEACDNLSSVTLGSGLQSIGVNAFADCTSLTEITIPSSVTAIDAYAFSGCENLARVVFAVTDGWYADSTEIPQSDLANASVAATYLTQRHCNKYWERR